MLAQEEIEKAKGWLSALDIKSEFEAISKEIISQYIEQLEQENNKQNKVIDEMADIIKDYDIDYSDICKHRIVQSCSEAPKSCKECVKQYFEKKVEEN